VREEEEGAVLLFDPFFAGGGGGMVTAGFSFAAADEDATEEFFVSRPVSFLCPFFVGIVSGCGSWMARRIAMCAISWV
jgi:hypothetical protein